MPAVKPLIIKAKSLMRPADSCEGGGLGIAADRIDVDPEVGPRQHQVKDDEDDDGDDHRTREAVDGRGADLIIG
jgi:hypothetical protein